VISSVPSAECSSVFFVSDLVKLAFSFCYYVICILHHRKENVSNCVTIFVDNTKRTFLIVVFKKIELKTYLISFAKGRKVRK